MNLLDMLAFSTPATPNQTPYKANTLPVTQAEAIQLFALVGKDLVWRNTGRVAGKLTSKGYRKVKYKGTLVRAHRLVWFMSRGVWPTGKQVDHVNGDPSDNRICNLRVCTNSQNNMNRSAVKSLSGVKGVSWSGERSVWRARVSVDGVTRSKEFKSLDEAVKIVREWREKLHGKYVNHGSKESV